MKVRWAAAGVMLAAMAIKVKTVEPEWNRAAIKECDRPCLVAALDGYMDAIFKHDPKAVPPLAIEYHMTENTGHIDVGGGVLLARACGADHVQDRGGRSGEWASGVSGALEAERAGQPGGDPPEGGSRQDRGDRAAMPHLPMTACGTRTDIRR